MADDDDMRLAELLCARLCHDLAGPLGAVAAGAELLGEDGDAGGEAAALLADSAATAIRRLKFLRVAFGSGDKACGEAALRDLAGNYLAGASAPVALEWGGCDNTVWQAGRARLILLLVLLACDGLPRGGRIVVTAASGLQSLVNVAATGRGADLGAAGRAMAAETAAGLGPRTVAGWYAARVATAVGAMLHQRSDSEGLYLSAKWLKWD